MDKKERPDEKISDQKMDRYMILWCIWMGMIGCTVGTFWTCVIAMIIKKICL